MKYVEATFKIKDEDGNVIHTINKDYKTVSIENNQLKNPKYYEDCSVTHDEINIHLKEIVNIDTPELNKRDINIIIER